MQFDKNLIVITDLDGTLLDHYSYDFNDAQPALDLLNELDIPVILNSSKTAAEILPIRERLRNNYPFIVENGGGIYMPVNTDYEVVILGESRQQFLPLLRELRSGLKLRFKGFSEMSNRELAALTGLPLQDCENARLRDFTEPLYWQDDEAALSSFRDALETHGLQLTRGGRFVHVSGITDKGKSVAWLRNYYQRQDDGGVYVIALGDSPNDTRMLECADYALVIRSPAHPPLTINHEKLLISEHEGPQGWNEAIHKCLKELNII